MRLALTWAGTHPLRVLVLIALVGLPCGAAAPPLALVEAGRYACVGEPGSVAVADLDGDGRLDAVVANQASGMVSVFRGLGGGALAEARGSPFPAGPNPNDLAVGDFDSDGRPDLAIANHDSDRVTILLAGEAGFGARPAGPLVAGVRPHPHGIAAADLDGDGDLDLALDSWEDDTVRLFWGDGAGDFTPAAAALAVGPHPYQKVRLADVDGNGAADVLTADLEGSSVTVLLGDGRGGFRPAPGSPFPAGDAPFAVAAGDLDGDGAVDLAVTSSASNSTQRGRDGLALLRGDGRGGFAAWPGASLPLATGRAPVAVAACDLDGDGRVEAVTADYSGDSFTLARVTAQGVATSTHSAGRAPEDVACGDLDGDGRAELLVVLGGEDELVVLRWVRQPAQRVAAPLAQPALGL
ncbi:MAG: VCBS repeat-containing protein [Chloroflexi bacterium]|nr:VCBS repeat-containing protein [Chloroflexota bacterium]